MVRAGYKEMLERIEPEVVMIYGESPQKAVILPVKTSGRTAALKTRTSTPPARMKRLCLL